MADAWGDASVVNFFKPPLTGSLPIGYNPAPKKPSSHVIPVLLYIDSPSDHLSGINPSLDVLGPMCLFSTLTIMRDRHKPSGYDMIFCRCRHPFVFCGHGPGACLSASDGDGSVERSARPGKGHLTPGSWARGMYNRIFEDY